MDYKQKYEQALERAKKEYKNHEAFKGFCEMLVYIFPELKESEDERIRKALIQYIKYNVSVISGWRKEELIAWLEKQKDYEDELEKAYKTADEVQYRRGYEAAKREFEKQGEMKPQGNSALEIWKDMRLEVYQQASGNRHEPNYSDDSTKMFSLTDIDEIFEKVAEKQGEQKPTEDNCKILDCVETVDMTEYNNGYECGKQRVLKYPEEYGLCKKPAWSEEDEKMIELLIAILEVNHPNGKFKVNPQNTLNMKYMSTKKIVAWLKSLKERMKEK